MNEKNFEVGDIVIDEFDEYCAIITKVGECGVYVLWSDGSCGWTEETLILKKIDKCLDIEQNILSKLRSYEHV